ncbi:MAG: hypothetical protein M3Y08_14765 [Fibrobacterota bacterium]|nr:hypothetical protein [Fibrobacterota bacterium]
MTLVFPKGKFARDVAYLLGGSVTQSLFLFLVQILLANNLTLDEYGRLAFFNGLLLLFNIIGTAGTAALLPALARRRAAEGKAPPHAMLVWSVCFAALFAVANIVAYAGGLYDGFGVRLDGLYFWMSATLFPVCVMVSIQAIFVGYGRTRLVFHAGIVLEAARLAVVLLLIGTGGLSIGNLILGWFALQALATLINLGAYLAWVRRFPEPFREAIRWTPHNVEALVYLVPSSAGAIMTRLLVFLTGVFHSSEETAVLNICLIFMSAFSILLAPYQTALLSHFQQFRDAGDPGTFVKSAGRNMAVLIFLSAGAAYFGGRFWLEPLFGIPFPAVAGYLAALTLLFALDAPRALFDVFFITFMRKRSLIAVESAKLAGVVAVFTAIPGSLRAQILCVAVLGALANLYKGGAAAAYLSGRMRDALA